MTTLPWPRACLILARLFLKQILRSKVVWIMGLIVSLPGIVAIALAEQDPAQAWMITVGISTSLLAIVPPVFAGGVVADELDSQTYTFLWSRPLPRWTVLVGKLLGAIPLVTAAVVASVVIGWSALDSEGLVTTEQLRMACLGLAVGSVAACTISAGIGTLVVRHPIVAGIVYMLLLDVTMGAIPFSLRHISLSFQVSELAGVGEVGVSAIWSLAFIAGVTALWLGIGLWRIGRLEGIAKS